MVLATSGKAQEERWDWLINISETVDSISYDPSPAGSVVRIAVTVSNDSTRGAPPTTLSIMVPDPTIPANAVGSVTLVGTSGTITNCQPSAFPVAGGTIVTCDVPAIPGRATFDSPANSAQVVFDFQTTVATVLMIEPSVPNDDNDANDANNSLSETLTVTEGVDLEIDVTTPSLTVAAGEVFDWFVNLRNIGPNTADRHTVTVPVPTGVININLPAGCSLVEQNYICQITTPLPSQGNAAPLAFRGQVGVSGPSDISISGQVSGAAPLDPNADNDDDLLNINVTPGTDTFISKSRSPQTSTLLVGDMVTFTLATGYVGNPPTNIVVMDTLPVNYEIISVSGPNYTCTEAPFTSRTVTCTQPVGGSNGQPTSQDLGTISIVARLVAAGQNIRNTATIATDGVDINPANNTSSDTALTVLAPFVDLQAQKTGPTPALAVVGNAYAFNIRARNGGNAPFTGALTLTDTIPAGLTVTSVNTRGAAVCTVNGMAPAFPVDGPAVFVCVFNYATTPLAAATNTPNITFNARVTAPGSITNRVVVSSGDDEIDDTEVPNNTAIVTVTAVVNGDSADVQVIKSLPGGSEAIAGQPFNFDIEIRNNGPQSASNVRVTDVVSNLQNGSNAFMVTYANTPAGTCTQSGSGSSRTLTCNIETVPPCGPDGNPSVSCPVIGLTIVPGRDSDDTNLIARANTVRAISQDTPDPDLGNNVSIVNYTMERRADVTVRKTAVGTISAGQNLLYSVSARNADIGLSRAENVTITDFLPPNVRFVSATAVNGGTCTAPASGTVTDDPSTTEIVCDLGTIQPNAQRNVNIVVQPTNAAIGQTLVNSVSVTTTTIETNPDNNTAQVSTVVTVPDVDLQVNKQDNVDPLTVGDNVTYTVRVTNNGPSASESIVVTDTWPGSLISLRSVAPPAGGTCDPVPGIQIADTDPTSFGATITCRFPLLRAGQDFEINYVGTGVAKGTIRNDVAIRSFEIDRGYDRLAANNIAEEGTTVRTQTDVSVTKRADPETVNVRDTFNWIVRVAVAPASLQIAEADDVRFTDTLPLGMQIVATPSAVLVAGAAPGLNSCTGAPGTRNIVCDFGTMQPGSAVDITIPVRVNSVTAEPQSFVNTARVTTTSFDTVSSNNQNTASVGVLSSSIAGNVFRDFVNDAAFTTGDTPVQGVVITLTGQSADGLQTINRTFTTDAAGDFVFPFLPEGTYTLTRGAVNEPYLVDGTITPGNNSGVQTGTTGPGNAISTISLPGNTDNVDNLFPVIPQARIGIAKSGTITSQNIDGTFNATFDMVVENFSREPLVNVTVTDQLSGTAPFFGTYQAPDNPLTDPLAQGQYTIIGASGTCGNGDSGFDGSGNVTLSSGGTLAPGGTCTLSFSLRVYPTTEQQGTGFENQAVVTGEGEISGQTSAGNPQLRDLSDNGVNPDPNGNNRANELGENDPTPLNPSVTPGIALIKVADLSGLDTPVETGDVVTYRFTVRNTGNVTLTDITVEELLIGATVTGSIASLDPDEENSTAITATYPLTLVDVDAGEVENRANVTGTDPFGTEVTDLSGTALDNNMETVTVLDPEPAITLVKTADVSQVRAPTQIGDTISYSFTIRNTGNVTLRNVTVTDDVAGVVLVGDPIAVLAPGATNTDAYSASYVITGDDIIAGEVRNTALVTGTDPNDTVVTDTSGTTGTTDDETVTELDREPAIRTVKTQEFVNNPDTPDSIGEEVIYTITVENTGNVPLTDVRVVDTLTDLNGAPLTLTSGPDFVSADRSSPEGSLAVGEIATYTATFVIDVQAVNAGGISNTVTAFGTGPSGSGTNSTPQEVSDVSDNGNPLDGNTQDDPTDLSLDPAIGLDGVTLTKTTPNAVVTRGVAVPYTITVTNGNIFTVGPVDIVDTLPNGMIFISGSATINGAPADVSFTAGRVTWSDVIVPALGTTQVTLSARILNSASGGEFVNRVSLIDPETGRAIVPDATATVTVPVDALFQCVDIIGKVFDDVNGNGYQDAPNEVDRSAITDQTYDGAKGTLAGIAAEPQPESGIPGVRLATVDGTIITTDENGLYSVPCAALPAAGGENFILKLDDRSLPAGYRMTTENPRVMRVTPGMMTEMNFGATATLPVVRVDLTTASFVQGAEGMTMSAPLRNGLRAALQQIAGTPSTMVLAFHLPQSAQSADVALARALSVLVEDQVKKDWREIGQVRLRIEQTIVRAGE